MKNPSKLRLSLALVTFTTLPLAAAPLAQWGNGASLHALGSVEMVYQDNIFRTPVNKESDLMVSLTPGLELRMAREGAASVTLKYQHVFELYDKFGGLDNNMARLSLGVRYDSGVILASLNASYQEFSQTELDITNAGRGNNIERDVTSIGGNVKYGISRLTAMSVGVSYDETDYKLPTYTDTESYSVPVTFFYKIRPSIDLTAGVRWREVDASTGTGLSQDFRDIFYFVGAVGEFFSPVLFADVQIGLQDRKYKGNNKSIDTPTFSASLIYAGDPKTTFSATLRRDYRVSAVELGTYVTTIGTLAAQYSVNQRTTVSSSINFGQNDYENPSPRKEDLFVFTLGASYRANDLLTLAAGYEYHKVDSNDNSNDYEVNKFKVSASLRY